MVNNSGDSAGVPEPGPDAPDVDAGRLGGLFLRLQRRRFTGLAYVSSGARTITFAFRNGAPVTAEEAGTETSLAEQLMERQLITRDEYATVIARVTEQLVDDEDVAFGEHAVSLGFMTEQELQAELADRVRAKLTAALALTRCTVELDDSPDALSGKAEYPQKLGPAVYIGVRTFYEDAELRRYLPDLKRNYCRLRKPSGEITRFFELDYEEVALLNSIEPEARASTWFEDSDLERSHALQLLGLLFIAELCEFSTTPWAEAERSGERAPDAARSASRTGMPALRGEVTPRPGSRGGMPAVREEVYEPRSASRTGLPAVQAEAGTPERREGSGAYRDPRPASEHGSGAHREPRPPREEGSGAWGSPLRNRTAGYVGQAPAREEGSGAWGGAPRSRSAGAAPGPVEQAATRDEGSGAFSSPLRSRTAAAPAGFATPVSGATRDGEREPPAVAQQPTAATRPEGPLGARTVQQQPQKTFRQGAGAPPGVVGTAQGVGRPGEPSPLVERAAPVPGINETAAAEALAEARARVARDGRRGGGYAAQGVAADGPSAASPGRPDATAPVRSAASGLTAERGAPLAQPPAAAQPAVPEYQKAHLQELMARRRQAVTSPDVPLAPKRDPLKEFRSALESLRDHQYSRAEEQLRVLLEQQPENDAIRAHHLWAQLRAAATFDPAHASSLRDLAKKLVAEPEHAGFACYVLGHLYLAEKKDDQAEKYFRKAYGFDKTNKDAERHVVILERRKHQAAESEAPGQRKIFGISLNKPKP